MSLLYDDLLNQILLGPGGPGGQPGSPASRILRSGLTNPAPAAAQPAMQQQSQAPGGFGGAIGSLFGGQWDPQLSEEQNRGANRQAMLQAGLATLAAGGNAPGLSGVAQGIMAGQQYGAQARGGLREQGQADRMRQIAAGSAPGDLQSLYAMLNEAVAQGDSDMATRIATAIQSATALQAQQQQAQRPEPQRMITAAGRQFPDTPEGEEQALSWMERTREIGRISRTSVSSSGGGGRSSGGGRSAGGAAPAAERGPAAPRPLRTEDARKAAGFLAFIPDHSAFIDGIERAPGRLEQAASDRGIREFNGAEQQQLRLAGSAIAEAWLRMTTGAGYNAQEFQTAQEMFTPQPGDRREALEVKRRNRQRLMQMLRARAGLPEPEESDAPAEPPARVAPRGAPIVSPAHMGHGGVSTPLLDRHRGR